MITVTMKQDYKDMKKGRQYQVTNNIAHGLIDSGKAIKYKPKIVSGPRRTKVNYITK